MNVLLLSAGYGTRLEVDLLNSGPDYRHLVGVSKALLPVAGRPLSSRWMDMLRNHNVHCIINDKFQESFQQWAKDFPNLKLVSDKSTNNDNRAGAVACMSLASDHFNIENNLLVIAGDTLLYEDFILQEFVNKYQSLQEVDATSCLALYTECKDEDVSKTGIIELDNDGKIVNFLEKPSLEDTLSRKSCPCFYLFSNSAIQLLKRFLDETKDLPMKKRDATGKFIEYLYTRNPIYTMKVKGRFDVGKLDSYIVCNKYFSNKCSN